ncbi:MAG: citrate/2-methylcitrate synthase [Chlamydiia bacterium]
MHDTLFELTEDHLLEGPRSIPMGYVGTSHVDLEQGLMYFGESVELFGEEPIDQLVERFLGYIPCYQLKEETKVLMDQIDRQLDPLEQLHQAIEILAAEEHKETFQEQLDVVLGSMKEVAELLFGPLPIDPLFYALHLDEGGGSPPAFTAKVLASNGCDAYKAIQGALLAFHAPRIGKEMENALKLLQEIDLEEMDREIADREQSGEPFYGYDLYPFVKADTRSALFERALAERFMDEPLFQKALLLKQKLNKVAHSHAFSGLYLFYRGFEEVRYYSVILFLARLVGIGAQLMSANKKKGLEIHPYYFYRKEEEGV